MRVGIHAARLDWRDRGGELELLSLDPAQRVCMKAFMPFGQAIQAVSAPTG